MNNGYEATWESVREHEVPQWYDDAKLGIFVHWGAYCVPAWAPRAGELGEIPADDNWFCNNPYTEWYFNSINVGRGPTWEHHKKVWGEHFGYENFARMWKAQAWQPQEWAKLFREAGAGYVVLTTKHHDGLCLFPSRYTDYNTVFVGPERDIMGELTRAVRAEGLKMGAYYSGILDWRFAQEPIFREEQNFTSAPQTYEYADYAYNQMLELIDRYHPSVLWNDLGWPKRGEENLPALLSHYYNSVADGVINDRWNGLVKDFACREYKSGEVTRGEKWEKCRGMGHSFGYNTNEDEACLLSEAELIGLLVSTVAGGGNLLINVGPMADGTIPPEQARRLRTLGDWLRINGEAIYGTEPAEFLSRQLPDGVEAHFTQKGGETFMILDRLPQGDTELLLEGIPGNPMPLDARTDFADSREGDNLRLKLYRHDSGRNAVAFRLTGLRAGADKR